MSLETQSRSLSPEEQVQQEHQRKLDGDPTRQFLRGQGFQGDSKVLYSMNIISAKNSKGESLMGSQVFDNFEDLQKFIKDNPDALTQKAKDQMKEGIMPFGVGYDKAVYDWSGSLPTEKKKQMEGAWDSFGADNFDTRKWGSKKEATTQAVEEPKDAQQTQNREELLTKARTASSSRLENLYAQAGIPEGTASRDEFFRKVGAMSAEELHTLDLTINKTARESMRDPKMLEGLLMNLSVQSFKPEDVRARQEAKHQKNIDTARVNVMAKFEGTEAPNGEKPLEGDGWREVEQSTGSAGSEDGEVNEQKQENPFQALVDSPEKYSDQLEDIGDYSPKKGIGAVMEVLQKLYPDKKQRAKRIQEIFGQYGEIRDEDRKKRPGADKSSSEDFGVNQTVQRLSEIEQQALEKIIEEKIDISQQTFAGKTKFRATKELVLGNFIQFLEGIKK